MSHHHHHHRHSDEIQPVSRLVPAIIINLLFVGIEFLFGSVYHSAGLLADAGHNLSDAGGLMISLTAILMLKKENSDRFTFGFRKATIHASLLNALILLAAVGFIFYESIGKLIHPVQCGGWAIIGTASAGILVNGFTVLLLHKGSGHDLNMKGAYLHMLADTLVSLGVAVSGTAILLTDQMWIDPLTGILIACIILWTSRNLFTESFVLAMDGVPESINPSEIRQAMCGMEHVNSVEHLHIWAVSTTENAMTACVRLDSSSRPDETETRHRLKHLLKDRGISHATLEFETVTPIQQS